MGRRLVSGEGEEWVEGGVRSIRGLKGRGRRELGGS